jgi:hypothetical protein
MKNVLTAFIWIGAAFDIAIIGYILGVPWWYATIASFPLAMLLPDFSYDD